jgi:hypothetical protein
MSDLWKPSTSPSSFARTSTVWKASQAPAPAGVKVSVLVLTPPT